MKIDSDSHLIGLDIGGTKISVSIGSGAGKIIGHERFATRPERGPEAACDEIMVVVSRLLEETKIQVIGLGISAPGPLSSKEGRFLNPPNMPSWHGFPIQAALEERLGLPTQLMNDANAAAYAEWKFGAGRGSSTMIFFTMSTGMGAGLVIDGRLHEGADDMAGEVGHLSVSADGPVGFGVRGSIEGFCSGPGLAQLAVMKLIQAKHAEEPSRLFELEKDFRLIDAVDVGHAARANDAVALATFREVGQKLGVLSATLVDVLNPERIVVGTIGRLYADLILPSAREVIDARAHPRAAARVELLPAALGERTGDLAALCAWLARVPQT